MKNSKSLVPSCKFSIKCKTLGCFFTCKKCQFVAASKGSVTCQCLAAVYERRRDFIEGIQILQTVTDRGYFFVTCGGNHQTPLKKRSI